MAAHNVALTVALAAASTGVLAQEVTPSLGPDAADRGLELEFSGGMSWSDNISRVPVDEDDGSIGRAGMRLGYGQTTRRSEVSLDANLAYEHYTDDTFDDDVVGGAAGLAILGIVPERFLWVIQDNYGQIISDPFAADTPDNRENINFLTTGPDLLFRFGATSLKLSGRYSDTQYETSDIDSNQYSGLVALGRELSGTATLSLNAQTDRIEFDNAQLNQDYDRRQAFVRYDMRAARTALQLDAGYTQLDLGDDKPEGLLGRLSVTRRMGASSSLKLAVGTQFSDSGALFRDGQNAQGMNQGVSQEASNVVGVSDPFESRYVTVGYDFRHNRTGFGISAQFEKEDYETATAIDRKLTLWSAYFSRQLSRVLNFGMSATLEQEEFERIAFEDDDLRAEAHLGWSIGRTVALRLQYGRYDRDSTDPTTDYTENQVSFFVVWTPIGRL